MQCQHLGRAISVCLGEDRTAGWSAPQSTAGSVECLTPQSHRAGRSFLDLRRLGLAALALTFRFEEGRADADVRRPLLHRHLEVVRHPHRQLRCRMSRRRQHPPCVPRAHAAGPRWRPPAARPRRRDRALPRLPGGGRGRAVRGGAGVHRRAGRDRGSPAAAAGREHDRARPHGVERPSRGTRTARKGDRDRACEARPGRAAEGDHPDRGRLLRPAVGPGAADAPVVRHRRAVHGAG